MNHKHTLIKAFVNNPPKQEAELSQWLTSLVEKIDMKVMMGPYSKYLDVQGNRGITGVVVIETSHCSIHVWDECQPAMLQMDVYSCKEFDPGIVVRHIDEVFGIISHDIMNIDRNEQLKVTC